MNTLVHFDQPHPENGRIGSHNGFQSLLGNTNRRKVAVALAQILQKINRENENKHLKDLTLTFLKAFEQ